MLLSSEVGQTQTLSGRVPEPLEPLEPLKTAVRGQ